MPYISNVITIDLSQKAEAMEAIEAIANYSPGSQVLVQIVALIIHPKNARPMVRSASISTKRDNLVNYVTHAMWMITSSKCEKP